MTFNSNPKQQTIRVFQDTEAGQSIEAYNRMNRLWAGESLSLAAFKDLNNLQQMQIFGTPMSAYISDLHDWHEIKKIAVQAGNDAALGMAIRLLVNTNGPEKKLIAKEIKNLINQGK